MHLEINSNLARQSVRFDNVGSQEKEEEEDAGII